MAEVFAQPTAEDLDILDAVTAVLERDNVVRETDVPVTISVVDGVVTLRGLMRSRMMHERVLYLAARVPGVKKVVDEMVSDPEIETLIARLVAADPELRPRQLSIASYMGQVTLYGELESEAQREKALAIAASVQGVQKVIDHLTTGAASPAG